MVAQLAGNLRGYRLWQGVAGTSLLPGHAVYTMPKTVSLRLCSSLVSRAVRPPRDLLSALNPGFQDTEGSLSGRSTIAFVLACPFFDRSIVSQPVESSKHFLKK
jgi:hypothetical protein